MTVPTEIVVSLRDWFWTKILKLLTFTAWAGTTMCCNCTLAGRGAKGDESTVTIPFTTVWLKLTFQTIGWSFPGCRVRGARPCHVTTPTLSSSLLVGETESVTAIPSTQSACIPSVCAISKPLSLHCFTKLLTWLVFVPRIKGLFCSLGAGANKCKNIYSFTGASDYCRIFKVHHNVVTVGVTIFWLIQTPKIKTRYKCS